MFFSKNDKKAGYSFIPEVGDEEEGLTSSSASSTDSSLTHAEEYPEANEQERAFLYALDHAIDKCSQPKITLPTFKAKDLGPPDSPQAFLDSLRYPTLALLASLSTGAAIVITSNPVYIELFPYVSCILAFAATIPPLRKRFRAQTQIILSRIKSQKLTIETNVMLLCNNAISQIDTAESYMDAALEPIRSKLDQITELEQTLRIVHPTIDIPDVSDIEEAFDGCTDQIRNVIGVVLEAVDYSTSRAVPSKFQSQEAMDLSIFYPLLGVLLGIQLFGILISVRMQQEGEESASLIGNTDTTVTEIADVGEVPYYDIGDEAVEPTQLEIMIVSIQTYMTTMVQLILAYLISNLSAIAKKINAFIKSIEVDVNDTIEIHTGEIFSLVFDKGLGGVRTKILKLIRDIEKIEGPLNKAREMRDYKIKMQELKEKALAEAENKAREVAEKAREAAEKAKEEAEAMARGAAEKAKEEAEAKAREAVEKAKGKAEAKAKEAKEKAEAKAREAKEKAKEKALRKKEAAEKKAAKAKAAMAKITSFGKKSGFGF
jgi:hypothetical protein